MCPKKREKPIFIEKAEQLLSLFRFKTMNDTGEIYRYDEGIYRPNAKPFIETVAQGFLGKDASNRNVDEVVQHVQRSTYISRDRFNSEENKVNLYNGVLDRTTRKLTAHSPEQLFTVQVPVNFNPNAFCPRIIKFLCEVLHSKDISTILEMFGFCLSTGYAIQKGFMLTGEGRNGKSTLLTLLARFLGSENISSVLLHDLDKNRFASSSLYGKMANICPDLPHDVLKNTGIFKALIGGDLVRAERKYKQPFAFVNRAKMIFGANRIPQTQEDKSEAFFRRWIIIEFPNKFEGDNLKPHILDELTTDEELSGLLNLALDGLERILANKQFSYNKSIEEIREYYERSSNPGYAFIKEMCEEVPDGFTTQEELYGAFARYCKAHHFSVTRKGEFNTELQQNGFIETRPSITDPDTLNSIRVRGWKNIRLKDQTEVRCQ